MKTTPLSPTQKSILYSLLYHMVRREELNLAAAAKAAQATSDTLDYCRDVTANILNVFSTIAGKQKVLGPLLGNIHHQLTSGRFESIYYLARSFDIPLSEYYFPGITPACVFDEDGDDDDEPEERCELIAGDLRREFPDAGSRTALIAEIERWTRLDPEFVTNADSLLTKVRNELQGQLQTVV